MIKNTTEHTKSQKRSKKDVLNNIKNVFLTVMTIIAIAYVFLKLVNSFEKNQIQNIEINKCQTNCRIMEVRINRGTYVKYQYIVNNVIYKSRCPSPFGAKVGDCFLLNYQCNNPVNNILLSNEIVFSPKELADTVSTRILSIELKEHFCNFSFLDSNFDTVLKTQELNDVLKNKVRNNKARVLYLRNNSIRAILK